MGGECSGVELVPLKVTARFFKIPVLVTAPCIKFNIKRNTLNNFTRFLVRGPGLPPLTTAANARMWTISNVETISSGMSSKASSSPSDTFSARFCGCGNCMSETSKPWRLQLDGTSRAKSSSQHLTNSCFSQSPRSNIQCLSYPFPAPTSATLQFEVVRGMSGCSRNPIRSFHIQCCKCSLNDCLPALALMCQAELKSLALRSRGSFY